MKTYKNFSLSYQRKNKQKELKQEEYLLLNLFLNILSKKKLEDNPSTLLEGPKLGLYLPDTLSFEDVEKIIKSHRFKH